MLPLPTVFLSLRERDCKSLWTLLASSPFPVGVSGCVESSRGETVLYVLVVHRHIHVIHVATHCTCNQTSSHEVLWPQNTSLQNLRQHTFYATEVSSFKLTGTCTCIYICVLIVTDWTHPSILQCIQCTLHTIPAGLSSICGSSQCFSWQQTLATISLRNSHSDCLLLNRLSRHFCFSFHTLIWI